LKYWETIADNLKKAGWSWGCVASVDEHGRTIWIADAHRGNGKRFLIRSDERLTAFVELESAIEPEAPRYSLAPVFLVRRVKSVLLGSC